MWSVFFFSFGLAHAQAQEPVSAPAGADPAEAPLAATGDQGSRPGRFRAGPVWLTPSLRISQIGVDTNVLFTQRERERDITASGGPGLEMVLPLGRALEAKVDGGLDYLWFAEQTGERRLLGRVSGRIAWSGPRFGLGLESHLGRTFERVDFEVDERLDQTTRAIRITNRIGRPNGGVIVEPEVSLRRYDVESRPDGAFPRADSALSREEVRVLVPVGFRLSPKSRFVVEAEYVSFGFLLDPRRDASAYRVGAGFELRSATRLSGRVLVGPRVFRPEERSLASFTSAFVAAHGVYVVGPKTSAELRYSRDLGYSATSVSLAEAPVRTNEQILGAWSQRLVGRVRARLWGGRSRFETRGEVHVSGENGDGWRKRKDEVWQGGVDLTYDVAKGLAVGVGGHYTERRSSVGELGLDGLSLGLIVNYAGPVSVAFRP